MDKTRKVTVSKKVRKDFADKWKKKRDDIILDAMGIKKNEELEEIAGIK